MSYAKKQVFSYRPDFSELFRDLGAKDVKTKDKYNLLSDFEDTLSAIDYFKLFMIELIKRVDSDQESIRKFIVRLVYDTYADFNLFIYERGTFSSFASLKTISKLQHVDFLRNLELIMIKLDHFNVTPTNNELFVKNDHDFNRVIERVIILDEFLNLKFVIFDKERNLKEIRLSDVLNHYNKLLHTNPSSLSPVKGLF